MRVIARLVSRFCAARADAALRRATARRLISLGVLEAWAGRRLGPGRAERAMLELHRLRLEAERDETSAREWRDLARRAAELAA